MLAFFPEPYTDETLYSIIGRYHKLTGNPDTQNTTEELLGAKTPPPLFFASHLDYMAKQFPKGSIYTPEYLIDNHTILKVFKPFLPSARWNNIVDYLNSDKGNKVQFSLGITTGANILMLRGIRVCPSCVANDMNKHGEIYYHRNHQIPGNYICHKHNEWLFEHKSYHNAVNRKFISYHGSNFQAGPITDRSTKDCFIVLSKDIEKLLASDLRSLCLENTVKKYIVMLKRIGLASIKGTIDYKRLLDLFIKHYPKAFLRYLECFDVSEAFIKGFFNLKKASHPIKHLLFIRFLYGSIDKFLMQEELEFYPFGQGPFPCLNPAAEHYKEKLITSCTVYRKDDFVGQFECDCGYAYTRRGIDDKGEKIYEISRTVKYGEVWDNALRSYVLSNKYSTTEIAEKLKTDRELIWRYTKRIKLNPNCNFHNGENALNDEVRSKKRQEKVEQYASDILLFIQNNPTMNRGQIRKALSKQYAWLSYYNKDILFSILPEPSIRNTKNEKRTYSKVDWGKRDEEFLAKANDAIKSKRLVSQCMEFPLIL